jgi:hypothetical protein
MAPDLASNGPSNHSHSNRKTSKILRGTNARHRTGPGMGRSVRYLGPLTALLLSAALALADTAAVPAPLQAKLTGKLALFDRAFAARAGERAHVLVVVRPGDASSTRFADELVGALKQIDTIGGLPHDEATTLYAGAEALAGAVKAQHPAIVYLSAGLSSEAHAIGEALTGTDVLTISAEPEAVARGVVAGFDLVSNQPKIVLNLKQAATQNVQLTGTVLKLAIVIGG